jgi:uncharacterized membrane protein YccC
MILLVKQPLVLLVSMFAAMVMSYSLLLFNYTASVVFTSSYVLLMFHLLAPGSMRIIGERAIDTVVGCMIAIGASHLFPYWEYRLMGKLVHDMIAAMRQYLDATWWWSGARGATRQPTFAGSAALVDAGANAMPGADATTRANHPAATGAGSTAPAGAARSQSVAAASAVESDYRYRLARKNVHVAFANLGQAFQRMMLEPKSAQKFVAELNDLLVRSHVLASQITAAAPLLRSTAKPGETVPLDALERALTCVRENLDAAVAGTPAPSNQIDMTKLLTRDLDAMVVGAERALGPSAELTQELKLLAHQCKQMIAASWIIRKDASVIRLPE